MSFAIITLNGNITRDAEIVNFNNGKTGVKFGIAVNDSKEHVSFYDVLFSDESAVKFLLEKGVKGSAITIVGDLVINTKDSKTFVNVYGRTVVELFNRKATTADGNDTPAQPVASTGKPATRPAPKPTTQLPKSKAPTRDPDADNTTSDLANGASSIDIDDDFPF